VDSLILTPNPDPFTRGLDYLFGVRSLALDPEMVNVVDDRDRRSPICPWIGNQIDAINSYLYHCLQACQDCFYPWEQPTVQIFAAPLEQSFGIDALCNFQTNPITLLVDVGRVEPQDWLLAVLHEYAHAHAGSPGHHAQFARSLTHLCLGLDIPPPPLQPGLEDSLRFYPPYQSLADPLSFWRGEGADWRAIVTNSYLSSRMIS